MGNNVTAISTSLNKKELALKLGVDGFLMYFFFTFLLSQQSYYVK